MRILHVAHAVPPEGRTGVENYTAQLTVAQAKRGHTVAVFVRGYKTDVPAGTEERLENDGVLTIKVQFGPGHQHGHQRDRWNMSDRFRKFAAEWKPDVVHFQHLLYHSLDYPHIARQNGAATLLTLHDFWFTCPIISRFDFRNQLCQRDPGHECLPCLWNGKRAELLPRETLLRIASTPIAPVLDLLPMTDELTGWRDNSRYCLEAVDIVISPSRFVADDLTKRSIVPRRLEVRDIAIPRPSAEISMPDDSILRFGVIGTHRLKGMAVAVEAFRRLTDAPVQLLLYGTDTYENLPANVRIGGRFMAADIERVYGSFHALIVPSIWYENAPLVIREAFARQRPVVTSNIGGMAESVQDGVNGLHFAVGDPEALAATLRRLVNEPGLLGELQNGIRPPRFYDEHLTELEALYHAAQDKSKRP